MSNAKMWDKSQVLQCTLLSMQVCVPKKFTNQEVLTFAEFRNPCGMTNGWFIRKEGDKCLKGAKERVSCADRTNFVHIILDA